MIGSAKALILSSGQPLKTIRWLSLSLCLVGCVTNANSPNEQAKIWNDTIIDINGHPPRPVSDIASFTPVPQEKMPAVVYLHGCGGRGNSAHSHIRFFKLMGFAVFAPNHHSRSNAVTQCDPDKAKTWGTLSTRNLRISEAKIVRKKIREIDWIDETDVYLVGHSEGGWAAAHYPNALDFKGIIVIAGPCIDGLQTHTKMLTITARNDEFIKRNKNTPCARFKSPNSSHLVVEGGDHNFTLDSSYLSPPERRAAEAIELFVSR